MAARAEERLGYAPRYSNRDALIRNYDWFMTNRAQFAGGDPGSRRRWPW